MLEILVLVPIVVRGPDSISQAPTPTVPTLVPLVARGLGTARRSPEDALAV